MAASAPMQQYMQAQAENRLRDQMGQQGGGMDAMMQAMMQNAGKTIVGKGRKRKAKK